MTTGGGTGAVVLEMEDVSAFLFLASGDASPFPLTLASCGPRFVAFDLVWLRLLGGMMERYICLKRKTVSEISVSGYDFDDGGDGWVQKRVKKTAEIESLPSGAG